VGLLDKAEERIETAVSSLFSKLSRAELQSVEITQAVKAAMDLAAKGDAIGSTIVPSSYLLLINPQDAAKVSPAMLGAIRSDIARYAATKSYRMAGDLELNVSSDEKISKGRIKVGSKPVDGSAQWQPVLLLGNQRYELKLGTTSIGRDEKADITVDDRGLSRIHFEIAWNGEVAAIRDLQSTNGTFLDGSRINELVLRSGSKIAAGRTEFDFQLLAMAGEASE
jgi:hypothetical protein